MRRHTIVIGCVVPVARHAGACGGRLRSRVFDRGKIRSIYSAMFYPADDVPVPNWPPYDGNWPVK